MTGKEREELLIRIDERQTQLLDIMGQIQENYKKTTDDHDARLYRIEHWRSRLSGAWIVLTIVTGLIGAAVSLVLTHIVNK